MIKTREQQISDKAINITSIDPRIDSPDVKVIYPSEVEELPVETMKLGKADRVETEPNGIPNEQLQEQPVEKKEEHICKVDIQEAVKQNLLGFIVLIVLSLGIGYLMGSRGTTGR